jgi:hypothetical protein
MLQFSFVPLKIILYKQKLQIKQTFSVSITAVLSHIKELRFNFYYCAHAQIHIFNNIFLGKQPCQIVQTQCSRGLSGYRARQRVANSWEPALVAGLSLNK